MFKSWLAYNGHEHDVAVEEFAQSVGQVLKDNNADHRTQFCTVINQPSDALGRYGQLKREQLRSCWISSKLRGMATGHSLRCCMGLQYMTTQTSASLPCRYETPREDSTRGDSKGDSGKSLLMRQLNRSTGHARCIMASSASQEMTTPETRFVSHGQNDRAFHKKPGHSLI